MRFASILKALTTNGFSGFIDVALGCDSLEQITPLVERANLGVCNAALQHPEAAIRVDIFHAAGAQHFLSAFDRARNLISRFGFGLLDVDHTQAKADTKPDCARS